EAATREISALPWLADVKVSRRMPDTVTIDVFEHSPRLLVNLGRLYYMNDRGEPFKELAPGENPDLPIVTGFNEDDLLSPGPGVRAALNEVFWLLEALGQRNDEFKVSNISEINYDMVRGLTLVTRKHGLEVKVGFGAYEEKFRRLGRVMSHLKLSGKLDGLVYLNLEASPRVTVRYADSFLSVARRGT
ncbi:cell division protein FtsQ/DivIB, partial [Deltaproteobacteria bacterium OttesenSCG-928-M10]|nr:cell division protein FtsQ/DivIB [Deltaproteobacteria bacterium OttesenSCG-928-M10]